MFIFANSSTIRCRNAATAQGGPVQHMCPFAIKRSVAAIEGCEVVPLGPGLDTGHRGKGCVSVLLYMTRITTVTWGWTTTNGGKLRLMLEVGCRAQIVINFQIAVFWSSGILPLGNKYILFLSLIL